MHIIYSVVFALMLNLPGAAQNLSSLTMGRNINATFSITAYDSAAQEWGIAVATNNIYVGNSTVYIQPGLGAFSVIAETEPLYATNGFALLKVGKTIREAIESTVKTDSESYSRQVAGIDAYGNCFAFTGSGWRYQQGFAGSRLGKNCIVIGNQLGDSVLVRMQHAFETTDGTLAFRLLKALVAGQQAGGQVSGKQSAALTVKGIRNEWFNNIDLRVDDAKEPFSDLTRLLNYHYGRIKLNQAFFALKNGNKALGKARLAEAEKMLRGWNGMQSKIAAAYIAAGDRGDAVITINNALKENPLFAVNLPAFYLLKDEPGMRLLIDEKAFTEKNWISAVSFLGTLNLDFEVTTVARKALNKYPNSTYLYYLLGQSLISSGRRGEAITALQKAIALDPLNQEAVQLFRQIKGDNLR